MIRPLQPIDVARYALSGGKGGSSRAYTMDRLRGATQSRLSLVEAARISVPLPRRSVCSWALVRSNRIVTIAAARPRSGPQTWEVSLLLTASDDDPGCIELLSQVCQGVARNGGETVFIRLVSDDPLVDVARLSGFAPCTSELLFCIAGRHATHSSRPVSLRKKSPADEYNLFQLFNASTPAESRFTFGMTFDRWKASQERSRGRRREFVYETDGDLRGWVKTSKRFGAGQLQVMIHPQEETNVAILLDYGLKRLAGARTVCCLVPEHQVLLQRLLSQRGYHLTSQYTTLVRSMVAPARIEGTRRKATIAST